MEFKSIPVAKGSTVSGTADPRTASSVILFEEFVPLEYRQQLREVDSSRRRLPSLFGTSSRKEWKPATTLNGRPYVVGHVPHSPSYREVEFEGLLRSDGSQTKILTLKTPDRQQGAPSNTSVLSPLSTSAGSPVANRPLSNIFLSPQTQNGAPIRRTSSRSSDNADTAAASASFVPTPTSPTPSKRASRFRLPVSPPSRVSGLPPAEYDTIDFEARLASFDDDVPTAKGRRRSRDDAWVDILVASNSRRLGAQDASLRDALKGGRSDPELASQEVSEVLAAVRGQLPSDDEDDEPEPVHDDHYFDDRTPDGPRDTTPGPRVLVEDEDEDADADGRPATVISKRSLGYFDLHPERRPQRFDDDDASFQSSPQPPQALDQLAVDDSRARASLEISEESVYDDVEPVPQPRAAPVQPLKLRTANGAVRTDIRPPVQKAATSLPSVSTSPETSASTQPRPQASKTASLIEMYRERERAGTAPVPQSRLPVRTGASLAPVPIDRERSRSPRPVTPEIAPPAPPVEPADALLDQPLRMSQEDINLMASRYVHGAPLHNVLEEEEEYEEE